MVFDEKPNKRNQKHANRTAIRIGQTLPHENVFFVYHFGYFLDVWKTQSKHLSADIDVNGALELNENKNCVYIEWCLKVAAFFMQKKNQQRYGEVIR